VRKATVARRGFIGWTLEVTGTRAHSSVIFREDLGSGSIYEAARILTAFHEELRGEQYLTFNPGIILGGTAVEYDAPENRGTAFGKTNVIAERTVVAGDLRTISSEQGERAKERMRAIVERNLPHTSATIRFRDSYPSMPPTEGNYAVLAELDRLSRDLGHGPVGEVDPGRRGAADISFVAAHVREGSLSGLGPEGEGSHTVHETLYLNTVPVMAKRAALLVYRLTRE
jgi:glutamate carboxypeptidase